uniref:ATP-dependent DNA helicase n=1 Tax=Anopheles christyi TaxID=43041 RepID=A0A182KDN1_9DIPT
MTINKAQGQILNHLGLDLPTQVFAHGQLYVALSKVTSRSNVTVLILDPEREDGDGVEVKNVVFREVIASSDGNVQPDTVEVADIPMESEAADYIPDDDEDVDCSVLEDDWSEGELEDEVCEDKCAKTLLKTPKQMERHFTAVGEGQLRYQ